MSKSKGSQKRCKSITPAEASRVQGAVARENGGQIPKGSYVGRMQRAAAKNFGKSGSRKSAK